MTRDKVQRHSRTVRILHWMIALSGLALIFTGMGELPMYQRYNLTKVPGFTWSGDFQLNLVLHYLFSLVFTSAAFFHAAYHLRRREFAALPQRGDVKESVLIVKTMVTGGEEPPHGKYLAEQRLAYGAIALSAAVLIATGLVKSYKNLGAIVLDPTLLQVVTLTHTTFTMLFLVLFLAHVGAFLLKANWPLIPTMFTGQVSHEYARKRHGKWEI